MPIRQTRLVAKHVPDDDADTITYALTRDAGGAAVDSVVTVKGGAPHSSQVVGGDVVTAAVAAGAFALPFGETKVTAKGVELQDILAAMASLPWSAEGADYSRDDDGGDLAWFLPEDLEIGPWRCEVRIGRTTTEVRLVKLDGRWTPIAYDDGLVFFQQWLNWSFMDESGGPMIWDGSTRVGLLSPTMLVRVSRGDLEQGLEVETVQPTDYALAFEREVEVDWLPDFLRAVVGFPGRDYGDVGQWDVNGSTLTISDEAEGYARQALEHLMERPDVQGAVQALKDPSTDLGTKVYEVLDHLAKGDPAGSNSYTSWGYSWRDIDELLF